MAATKEDLRRDAEVAEKTITEESAGWVSFLTMIAVHNAVIDRGTKPNIPLITKIPS